MKFKQPCSLLTETQKAYLAGIIDGEGCLRVDCGKNGKGTVKYSITITVANTNFNLIKYLHSTTNIGSVLPIPKKGNRKPQLRWTVYSKQAEEFLLQVLPYLLVKEPQAKILLEARKHCRIPGRRGLSDKEKKSKEKLYLKIKKLNRRGL
jgi:hypothetical protein